MEQIKEIKDLEIILSNCNYSLKNFPKVESKEPWLINEYKKLLDNYLELRLQVKKVIKAITKFNNYIKK